MRLYFEIRETANNKFVVEDTVHTTFAFNDLNEVAEWLKTYVITSL